MSKENVELVRGLQPSPDVDLVQMFGNNGKGMLDALKPFFHDDVVIGGDVFGSAPEREGLEGLKARRPRAEGLEGYQPLTSSSHTRAAAVFRSLISPSMTI